MRRMPNELRYTFTVTPIAPYDIWVRIQRNRLTDEAGNQNGQIDGPYIRYVAPANKPPVADAGPDQTVVSGATVTLDGSGSDDPDGSIKSYESVLNISVMPPFCRLALFDRAPFPRE